jgi:hypothetical protein
VDRTDLQQLSKEQLIELVYCGTVLRQLAALAQAAKGKAATGVGSIASRDMVCSSLT